MGVMKCDRRHCENIICDRYSPVYGYICSECYEEMVQGRLDIDTFMATSKDKIGEREHNYDSAFKLDKDTGI